MLLDLALTLALGGDTCSDLAVVRAEPAVFGPVASDPTLSRTIARLAADVDKVLPAIDRARAAARARVWAAAGTHAPDHDVDARRPVVVDVDATLVTSHSEKENARPTFTGRRLAYSVGFTLPDNTPDAKIHWWSGSVMARGVRVTS